MKTTQAQVDEIVRLLKEGHNDADVSERLQLPRPTVTYWRCKLGLPPVRKVRDEKKKRYEVYNGKTAELVVTGTADKCVKAMGITLGHFYTARKKFEEGTYQKYEIYEVEE